jgi:hypothetical protein
MSHLLCGAGLKGITVVITAKKNPSSPGSSNSNTSNSNRNSLLRMTTANKNKVRTKSSDFRSLTNPIDRSPAYR